MHYTKEKNLIQSLIFDDNLVIFQSIERYNGKTIKINHDNALQKFFKLFFEQSIFF